MKISTSISTNFTFVSLGRSKYVLPCMFLCCSFIVNAQYWVEGISNDDIENTHQAYTESRKAKDWTTVDSLATILYNYWIERVQAAPKGEASYSIYQNYHNSYINQLEAKFFLRNLPKGFMTEFLNKEQEMQATLDDSNVVFVKYYENLGSAASEVLKDVDLTFEAYNKGLQFIQANFGMVSKQAAETFAFIGQAYRKQNNHDQALEYLYKAIDVLEKLGLEKSKNYITYKGSIAIVYYKQSKYQKAIQEFLNIYEITKQMGPEGERLEVIALQNIAENYRILNNFEESKKYGELSLLAVKKLYPDDPLFYIKPIMSVSSTYTEMAENQKALDLLDTAINIVKLMDDDDNLGLLYHNKALLQNDLNKSIQYFEMAIDACPNDAKCYKDHESRYYVSLGEAYQKKGNKTMALNCYRKAENMLNDLPNPPLYVLITLYQALAQLEEDAGNLELAIKYLKQASQIADRILPNSSQSSSFKSSLAVLMFHANYVEEAKKYIDEVIDMNQMQGNKSNYRFAKVNMNIANYFYSMKDFEKAEIYARQSIDIYEKNYGEDNYRLNSIRLLIAKIQKASGSLDGAKQTLDKISGTCGFDFSNHGDTDCIPEFQLWNSFQMLLDFLEIEDQLYEKTKSSVINRVRFGINLIDKLRNQFFFESSEYEFQIEIREYFDWALEELNTFYQEEEDEEILSLIFECIEKSRSIIINRNFNRVIALEKNEIPEKWISREKLILNKYQQVFERYEELINESNDSLRQDFTNQMLEMQDLKTLFMDSLEQAYPKYFHSRYTQSVCKLDQIQTLSKEMNRGFLLIHWSDSLFYQILISPNKTKLKARKTELVRSKVDSLMYLLSDNSNITNESLFRSNKNQFAKLSHGVSNAFFETTNKGEIPFDISIIPDGPLIGFPFEVLLTEPAEDKMEYAQLPYLLRNHAIHYLGSLTQFVKHHEKKQSKNASSYIGFGPSYESDDLSDGLGKTRDGMTDRRLIYNVQEIEQTSSIFQGENYLGNMATEDAFRNLPKQYSILHLAMHANVNDDIPMDSYLSFAKDSLGKHDGKLYVYEIAKMNLKHDLVVLSACETNKSEVRLGEGILGIAKSFHLASCQNLIMTNWLVDDKSASEIIVSFFKKYKKKEKAPHALRQAKLDYLSQSSVINSHPAFWAAFSFYGYPESNTNDDFKFLAWLLLPLFLFFVWKISKLGKKA